MKLKKIASLALAGVMAVSMLAGCAGKDATTPNTNDDATVATVTVADAMNAVQKNVEFKTSTTLDTWLAAATKQVTYAMLDGATADAVYVGNGGVYDQLKPIVTNGYSLETGFTAFTPVAAKSSTHLYLLLIDDVTGEEAAVNAIAKAVAGSNYNGYYPATVLGTASGNKGSATVTSYKATYTGEVSFAKVSKTNDEGKTASAYYALVAVTQTVAEKADTMTGVNGSTLQ